MNELNLSEPGNTSLDGKIAQLDRIFEECKLSVSLSKTIKRLILNLKFIHIDNESGDNNKTVHVSQARLDIVAFSKLVYINHQRIRRVAASIWTFRATDFANRIVRLTGFCVPVLID